MNAKLIVMLTYHDFTVHNAYEIFDQCKDSKAEIWGIKEEDISIEQMKQLYAYMKKCGKTTVLEVVAYTEEECLKGAMKAAHCGCDILMGTLFFDSVNEYCQNNNIKYMPFVGHVIGRPSVLDGVIADIVGEANEYVEKGVYGIDLLGYRYKGDTMMLNKEIVSNVNVNVCIAGSIDSYERLDEVCDANAWAFTIGGAFFENKFGGTFEEQINNVCEYIEAHSKGKNNEYMLH